MNGEMVVIDLDGTLITGNSFRAWLRFLAIRLTADRRLLATLRLASVVVLRGLRLVSHARMKRHVITLGSSLEQRHIDDFASSLVPTMRPDILDIIARHNEEGTLTVLATAAPETYLAPLARAASVGGFVGTTTSLSRTWLECRGDEKLDRLRAKFGDLHIVAAYTDHADDFPLVQAATHAFIVDPSEASWHRLRSAGGHVTRVPPAPPERASTEVGAIIVTHNSADVVDHAVRALIGGTVTPQVVVVVDSGSEDTGYLLELERKHPVVKVIRLETNVGFCAANNVGFQAVGQRHVLLVNPDAFVSAGFLADALARLENDPSIGALQPKLVGADRASAEVTGLIDSCGIGQRPWGQLFDIGQGTPDDGTLDLGVRDVSAACAATVLIRAEAVRTMPRLFDEAFFMYKEDVDLSWRLRRAGWRVVVDTSLVARHCRGWQRDRDVMPRWARNRSIANEWRLWVRGWSPSQSRWRALPYLLAKSCVVAAGR